MSKELEKEARELVEKFRVIIYAYSDESTVKVESMYKQCAIKHCELVIELNKNNALQTYSIDLIDENINHYKQIIEVIKGL